MIKVELDIDQYNKLAYNSVNYACGRSSYIVNIVIGIIRDNMKYLNYFITDEIVKLIVNRDYGHSDFLNSAHANDWRLLARDLLDHYNDDILDNGEIIFRDPDDLRLLVLTSFRSTLYTDSDIVPDYAKVLRECDLYPNREWFTVFKNDIDEAMYYGVDLGPYNEFIGMIYKAEREYAHEQG